MKKIIKFLFILILCISFFGLACSSHRVIDVDSSGVKGEKVSFNNIIEGIIPKGWSYDGDVAYQLSKDDKQIIIQYNNAQYAKGKDAETIKYRINNKIYTFWKTGKNYVYSRKVKDRYLSIQVNNTDPSSKEVAAVIASLKI